MGCWTLIQTMFCAAGWLAAFPFFEPHCQVLISNGKTSGHVRVATEQKEQGDKPRSEKNDQQDAPERSAAALPPMTLPSEDDLEHDVIRNCSVRAT